MTKPSRPAPSTTLRKPVLVWSWGLWGLLSAIALVAFWGGTTALEMLCIAGGRVDAHTSGEAYVAAVCDSSQLRLFGTAAILGIYIGAAALRKLRRS